MAAQHARLDVSGHPGSSFEDAERTGWSGWGIHTKAQLRCTSSPAQRPWLSLHFPSHRSWKSGRGRRQESYPGEKIRYVAGPNPPPLLRTWWAVPERMGGEGKMQWLEQTSVKAPAWPGVSSPNAGQFVERAQLSHTRSPSCYIAAVLSTPLSCRSSQREWPRAEPGWSQGGERPLGLDRGCPELGSLPARPDLGGDKQDQLQLQPQTCSSGAPVSTQSKHTPLLHTARSCRHLPSL